MNPYPTPESALPDHAAIGNVIARLQELQAEGVTHVHVLNRQGHLERVMMIAENGERFRYDDGKAIGVAIIGEPLPRLSH